MPEAAPYETLLAQYDGARHNLRVFMDGVATYIGNHPELTIAGREVVHSYKCRLKDRERLRAKIIKKNSEGREINEGNFFEKITDLAGVRILHLFQGDFSEIDRVIRQRVKDGDWVLNERPRAYTWDPEAAAHFAVFDLQVVEKVTSYTSVHYTVRPRKDSPLCCEVQVRTLFEEIWGEVDHRINYPTPSESVACREQIKVLSKIVGAGSRLLDSLQRVYRAGE